MRDRLAFLDGLRALAALLVVVHHTQLAVWTDTSDWTLYAGRLAVDVFIAISGFCLALPAARDGLTLKDGVPTFFWRRARRILPPYYVALLLSAALASTIIARKTGTNWDVSIPVTKKGLAAAFLMLNDVAHRHEINHVFWSIAVEWKIYFVFPLMLLVARRIGVLATTAITVVGSLAVYVLVRHTDLAGGTPHFYGLFALGMLGASIVRAKDGVLVRLRERAPWSLLTAGLAAAVVLLVAAGATRRIFASSTSFTDVVVGAATAAGLVTLAKDDAVSVARRALSHPWLVWIGGFSYSLYLVHAPLLQIAWQYGVHPLGLGPSATFAVLLAAGLPFVVGTTYLFHRAFERPFMSAAGRAHAARPATAAP